jgi:S-sulfo-L-cysteine synthase (3-phospho-L-serine-dependent)
MRRWAFVESNTTGTGAIALHRLRAQGDDVAFVTRDRGRYPFLDGIRVIDAETNDAAALASSVRALSPDAVVTFSTFYVAPVARLAADLGLRFLAPHAAETCHDKIAARRGLCTAGVPGPRFWVVDSVSAAAALADEVPYPCVMKPAADSGSNGVLRLDDARQFREHFDRLTAAVTNDRGQAQSSSVLVEELLDGEEFSVESITWAAGETQVFGVTRKQLSAPPHFVELGHDLPADLTSEDRLAIEAHVRRALDAVGFDFGPAHTELRLTAQGPRIVEINPRLAGGMIPELVRLATGVDLIDGYLRALVGEAAPLAATRHGRASIRFVTAPHRGTLAAVPPCDDLRARPGVHSLEITVPAGREVAEARSAADRLGYVICDDAGVADEVVAEIRGRLQILPTGSAR